MKNIKLNNRLIKICKITKSNLKIVNSHNFRLINFTDVDYLSNFLCDKCNYTALDVYWYNGEKSISCDECIIKNIIE